MALAISTEVVQVKRLASSLNSRPVEASSPAQLQRCGFRQAGRSWELATGRSIAMAAQLFLCQGLWGLTCSLRSSRDAPAPVGKDASSAAQGSRPADRRTGLLKGSQVGMAKLGRSNS